MTQGWASLIALLAAAGGGTIGIGWLFRDRPERLWQTLALVWTVVLVAGVAIVIIAAS